MIFLYSLYGAMDLFNPYFFLLIAFVLIFLEFFIPGLFMGILGGVFVVFSLVAFFLEGHSPGMFFAFFVLVMLALVLLVRFILISIKKTGKKNTIMLEKNQEGYVATAFDHGLMGDTGTATTDLKPAGKIAVGDKEVQALSEMGYITKGTKVYIVGGKGSHVVVRKLK